MRTLALAFALAVATVGAIGLTYPEGTQTATAQLVEVRLGALSSGSSAGADFSEGSAAVAGSLVSLRTDMLFLNNTNATGAWYAKIASVSASGLSNVVALTIGINNGTADVPQVTGALGALTQTGGTYVRIEPASTNRIYVTQVVSSLLAANTVLTLDVYAADSPAQDAYVITNLSITLT